MKMLMDLPSILKQLLLSETFTSKLLRRSITNVYSSITYNVKLGSGKYQCMALNYYMVFIILFFVFVRSELF